MYQIKRAQYKDMTRVFALLEKTKAKMREMENYQWNENYPNHDILAHDIKRKNLYMLESAHQLAGFLVLDQECSAEYLQQPWSETDSVLYIHRVTVSPDFQGKGIASKLLRFCEAEAKAREVRALHSSTHFRNIPMQYVFLKNKYQQVSQFPMQDRMALGAFFAYEKIIK